mmetsp:Transcript_8638/g.14878  ORF Transcript_8638/g.14878 Transcript_8638/m.14878 type:complete len:289 (+) Transcript_8638:165-1031(+)
MKFSTTKKFSTVFNRAACQEGTQRVQWPYTHTAAKIQFDLHDVPMRREFKVANSSLAPQPEDLWPSHLPNPRPVTRPYAPLNPVARANRDNKRSTTAPADDRRYKWLPKREVRKACPTCRFEWVDKYGRNECPKCFVPLDEASLALMSPQRRFKAADAMQSASGLCMVATKGMGYPSPHHWKYGKCNFCGLSEGYGKRTIPPAAYPTADPNQKRTMCHDGRKHTFKFSACTKCGERDFGRNFGPARARDADERAGSPGRAPSRGRVSTAGLVDKRSQFQSAFSFPVIW